MKKQILKQLILTGFLFAFIGLSAFSQIPNVKKEIPEGKWVLQTETVRADKACNHEKGVHAHEVSMKSINILFYTEIEVKGDMLYFISDSGDTLQTKYTYTRFDGIAFDSPSIPFISGGSVVADKLYMQQQIKNSADELDTIYVSFTYVLNK
jgi:hypothetical protein